MPIKAKPFGCQEQFDWGADIHSVFYDGRLSIRVLRNHNEDAGIEVTFPEVAGFRLLDEVPLAEYWIADDFPSGFPVLEVLDGGWAKEEGQRVGDAEQQREWIIVTAGACVSVFSEHEPEIRDAIWAVNAYQFEIRRSPSVIHSHLCNGSVADITIGLQSARS